MGQHGQEKVNDLCGLDHVYTHIHNGFASGSIFMSLIHVLKILGL